MHQSSSLDCCVCYQPFNLSDHLPRHIPGCCHTLCTTCILRILNPRSSIFKCPIDNLSIEKPQNGLDDFKPNYIVQDLLHEQSIYDYCPIHPNKELEYICLTDKTKICAHCYIVGDHRNSPGLTTHNVRLIKDLEPAFESRAKELQNALRAMDQRYQNIESLFEKQRKEVHKTIESRFEDFIFILRSKEKQLSFEVDAFFKGELDRFRSQIGRDAVIRQDLKDKVASFKNISKSSDIFGLLEQDIAGVCNEVYAFIDNEQGFENIKGVLKDINDNLDENLTVQINALNKLQAVGNDFPGILKEIYGGISERLLLERDQENPQETTTIVSIKSFFDIQVIDSTKLKIRRNPHEQIQLDFNLEDWKKIETLSVEILGDDDLEMSPDDLKTLGFLCNSLTSVHKIEISTRGQRNFPESSLLTLLGILFWKPSHLTAIEFHINSPNITHKTALLLSQQVIPKVNNNLKDLVLIFENSKINNEAFEDLTLAISPSAKNLRTLFFMIPNVNIAGNAINPLFVKLPNVTELTLDLSYMNFGDKDLEGFIRETVPSFEELKILRLYLQRTRITDETVRGLLEGLSDKVLEGMEDLKVNLSMTRITNGSLAKFVKNRLPIMKELKTIYIALDGTFVTNNVKTKIKIK